MDKRWKEDYKKLPARPVINYQDQDKVQELLHPASSLFDLNDYIKKAGLEEELGCLFNQFESLYESVGGTNEGLVQMASIFTLGMEMTIKYEALSAQAEDAKSKVAGSHSPYDEILQSVNKRIWLGLESNEKCRDTYNAVRMLDEVTKFENNRKEILRKKAELEGNREWIETAKEERAKWKYGEKTFREHRKRIKAIFRSKKTSLLDSAISI
jgi:hypothetical protein